MLAAIEERQTASPPRRRLTRGDRAVLELNGQLSGDRFELIEGDLVEKMPKNWPHTIAMIAFQTWLARAFGLDFFAPEAPTDVSLEDNPTSEPEPDFIVFNRSAYEFKTSKRSPEDLALVIEISNTSLRFDLTVKASLYARAGIADYWVLDIKGRRLGVHRDPRDGVYTSIVWYGEHESVAPLAKPDAKFAVASAFVP